MFYIVATPIGNLKEITYRAVEVLKSVDIILAEDTRHSLTLIKAYGITAPLKSYQKFNERSRVGEIIADLMAGKNIALISDAGMPLVSDPGSIVLSEIIACGLDYTVISGPCAAVNAAVLSGLDLTSFCMAGFLPEKNIDRVRYITKFAMLESTLIFYISPHSIYEDLKFLEDSLGARKASLVREISKIHEEVVRFKLGDAVEFINKGEFVLVVEGAQNPSKALSELGILEHISHYLSAGLESKEAIKKVAADRGVAKSIIYSEWVKSDKKQQV